MNADSDSFRQRRHDATAEIIITAADAAIARTGYARVTMRDIAAQAGCAPGTLYLYFKSKRAVLNAIAERHSERLIAAMTAAAATANTPLEKLRRTEDAGVRHFLEHRALMEALTGVLTPTGPGELKRGHLPHLLKLWSKFWDFELGLFHAAQARRELRRDLPPELLQEYLHAALHGILLNVNRPPWPADRDEQCRLVWRLLSAGLGAKPEGRR